MRVTAKQYEVDMRYLIQYKDGKRFIHGVSDSVSELVQFYFDYRKQHGYMTIEDEDCNTLATFGSK